MGIEKALDGVGLSIEELAITLDELGAILNGGYTIGHTDRKLRQSGNARLIALDRTCFEFGPESLH